MADRERARDLCQALNATRESHQDERRRILRELFGTGGETVWMQPPFFCDYGSNIELGERVFFNFNCVVLDVCRVRIGDFSLFGPAVQIYTADASARCGTAETGGIRQAGRHRLGRVGRRRSDHPSRGANRLPFGHRRRQRRHARRPRRACSLQAIPAGSSARSPRERQRASRQKRAQPGGSPITITTWAVSAGARVAPQVARNAPSGPSTAGPRPNRTGGCRCAAWPNL